MCLGCIEDVHEEIYRRCNPTKGDVLYTNIGVNLGTAALNRVSYPFSMKNVALLKPADDVILGVYLEHMLNDFRMKEEIKRVASLGGAQGFLSLKDIKKLKIPIAPLELQLAFDSRVSSLMTYRQKLKKLLNNIL